jgi:hypothetical protein
MTGLQSQDLLSLTTSAPQTTTAPVKSIFGSSPCTLSGAARFPLWWCGIQAVNVCLAHACQGRVERLHHVQLRASSVRISNGAWLLAGNVFAKRVGGASCVGHVCVLSAFLRANRWTMMAAM